MRLSLRRGISNADISACYRLLLGREPEDEEVVQAKLTGTRTLAGFLARFVQSQEYRSLSKVSTDDVSACYRLLLGREPENEEVVQAKLAGNRTIADILEEFLSSEEYILRGESNIKVIDKTYCLPHCQIETDPSPNQLAPLFERIRRQWSELGDVEPYWSVLTSEQFKMNNIDGNEAEFYRLGEDLANLINIFSERNSLPVPSGVCLELGCGVGRVTLHLAKMFEKVVGLDVSSGNLKIASNNIQKSAIVNVDLIKLSTIEDFDKIPNFDFLYSIIVLQHNPPPIQKMILDKLFAKMNAGGGCLFQIPTELPNYRFDAES